MVRYEDQCVGCATESYPCIGSACPNRHVPVFYCDECGEIVDEDDAVVDDGKELCIDCLVKHYKTINQLKKEGYYE